MVVSRNNCLFLSHLSLSFNHPHNKNPTWYCIRWRMKPLTYSNVLALSVIHIFSKFSSASNFISGVKAVLRVELVLFFYLFFIYFPFILLFIHPPSICPTHLTPSVSLPGSSRCLAHLPAFVGDSTPPRYLSLASGHAPRDSAPTHDSTPMPCLSWCVLCSVLTKVWPLGSLGGGVAATTMVRLCQ